MGGRNIWANRVYGESSGVVASRRLNRSRRWKKKMRQQDRKVGFGPSMQSAATRRTTLGAGENVEEINATPARARQGHSAGASTGPTLALKGRIQRYDPVVAFISSIDGLGGGGRGGHAPAGSQEREAWRAGQPGRCRCRRNRPSS